MDDSGSDDGAFDVRLERAVEIIGRKLNTALGREVIAAFAETDDGYPGIEQAFERAVGAGERRWGKPRKQGHGPSSIYADVAGVPLGLVESRALRYAWWSGDNVEASIAMLSHDADSLRSFELTLQVPRIRAARVEDAQQVCALRFAAIRSVCAQHYPAAEVEAWASGKEPEQYVAAIASNAFFVAEEQDELVGFAELHLGSAEVRAVYVRPDRLRRGIGAALLRAIEVAGRKHSLSRLHLCATLNAIDFYRAEGYSLDEMVESDELGGESALSCGKMHKDL